jgi:hypothetical protein
MRSANPTRDPNDFKSPVCPSRCIRYPGTEGLAKLIVDPRNTRKVRGGRSFFRVFRGF